MAAVAGEEFAGTERFEVLRRIGAGGMGMVYEALDRETRERVALKTLRSMGPEALLLFKREFRALSDLEHPNLVSLGELFEDGGQWFFTMELVDGEPLLAAVRTAEPPAAPAERDVFEDTESTADLPAPPAPADRTTVPAGMARGPSSAPPASRGAPGRLRWVDEAKLRSALEQLARGLAALHEAQKVHRDIKPSNVLMTPEGRVVILDFGVIAEVAEHDAGDEKMVGTVSYMAPEQAAAQRVGPEADWYAVGVVLYQALTGQLPVRGTLQEIAVLKRVLEPPPPSTLCPGIPADLDRLCVDLLRIDPRARPTAREVLRRLGADEASTPSGPSAAPRFVGRHAESAARRAAFDQSRAGAAVTVLVRGESGVGKSALVRRFAESIAAAEGALVLRSRCYERESVPYKAIDGVVDAMSRHLAALPEDEARALVPPHAGLLGQVFPVLGKVDAIARAAREGHGSALDPQTLRARLFAALRELCARIAARRPLVLCIDDLQWADADGLALLAEIMRPPGAPRLLLVATVRAALATETGPAGVAAVAAAIPGEVRQLALESLPPDDARALAAALLGEEAEGISAIASEAGGHPLFIDELVRRRLARAEDAGPVRLDDALWARITRLEPPARRLLELVVVAGAPIAQEAAARAAGLEPGDFAKQAALLRAANLARTGGARRSDAIEPYHDRLRAAVLAHLDGGEKTGMHHRLAQALEAAATPDLEALAMHWRDAGEAAKAAGYAGRAAEVAVRALAFDRAARLYRMAIELAPPAGADAVRLQSKLGDALANAGRGADAADAYLAAVPLCTREAEALDLRRRAADQLLRSGHLDRALAAFADVLAAVDLAAPATPKTALAMLLARRAQVRLRGLGFKERAEADVPPEQLTRIDACYAVGAGLGLVDFMRGSYFQVRALLLALEAGEPKRVARSLAGEVCYSSADGGRGRARTAKLHGHTAELARRLGDPYSLAWAAGCGGVAAALEGRWSAAQVACDRGEAMFRDECTGAVWEVNTMRWFALWALAYLGRIGEVSRRVPLGLRDAADRGDLYAVVSHSTGLQTLCWLADDDPAEAHGRCRDALERWSQRTFNVEHWWAMLAERQIDLYLGHGADAHRELTAEWPRLSGSLLLMAQLTELEARHLRARTALAAAEGRAKKDLLRAAELDARAIRRASMPWSDPLADLIDAGVAARRGEAERAIGRLTVAARGLDAADMHLYAAAARHRRGALEGGDEGRELMAKAERFMTAEGIKAPAKMIAMLAPGWE